MSLLVDIRFDAQPSNRVERLWRGADVIARGHFRSATTGEYVAVSGVTARAWIPGGALLDPAPGVVQISDGIWELTIEDTAAIWSGDWRMEIACTGPSNAVAVRDFTMVSVEPDVGDRPDPTWTLTAADVSGAVAETRAITAGTGLTGGGTLAEDRALALSAGSIASLALADSATQPGDLGTIATQNASAVAVTGGTLNGVTIGATTPAPSAVITGLDSSYILAGRGRIATWSGSNAQTKTFMGLLSQISGTGSYSGASTGHHRLVISGDTINASGGTTIVSGLNVTHNFGGTGCVGSRSAIHAELRQTAPYDPAVSGVFQRAQVTGTLLAHSASNDGGDAVTKAGGIWALNTVTTLAAGATHKGAVYGIEVDLNIAPGAGTGPADKYGVAVYSSLEDVEQGTKNDAAFAILQASDSLCPGFKFGILLSDTARAWPLSTDGTVLGVGKQDPGITKPKAAAHGVDLRTVTFSGMAFASTGFAVTGTGALSQRPAASATPAANGDLVFEATSNTALTVKMRGSDGVVRSTVLTLA